MALRLNLHGCQKSRVLDVLGSGDVAVLETAKRKIGETFDDDNLSASSIAWLKTLVVDGYPLRAELDSTDAEPTGDLIVSRMEGEAHIWAMYALVDALSDETWIHCKESSYWHHSSINALYSELVRTDFLSQADPPFSFRKTLVGFMQGLPLFGDEFKTSWSFYCFQSNSALREFIQVLRQAQNYTRSLDPDIPEEYNRQLSVRISSDCSELIDILCGMLERIVQAKQDAFVFWY